MLVLAVLLAACGGKEGQGGHGAGGGMPPAVVAVQEAQAKNVPVEMEYPAQTAGSREAEVRARVGGILIKRNYEEGEQVRAGQSLFTLDAAPFEAAAARAEADVAAAEARASLARRNAARMKPLFEAKAASQKDYDDAVSGEDVTAADVKAARARLAEARLNLGYTRVESPVSGLSSRSLKSEGSLVTGPQDLLTTVSQIDPIYVNFGLSSSEQERLRADAAAGKLQLPKDNRFEVQVRFEDGRTYARPGKLAFTDVRVNPQTGTSDARAEVPNPAGEVRPGQFVRVILKGAVRPNAITVPQRAVMEGPQGKMVYLLSKENTAQPRPVTVGDWTGTDWIITSGLNPGDKVIVDGLAKIFFPGAPVQVGDPNAPPPGAPGAPAKPAPASGKPGAGGQSPDAKKK
ncbi:MAG TPA: efflux RND transporter periplasmic adaptor subunit [Usitatibacter sp.]|nr:efflux RND transporter periplasmic adaptor subunit [Usitatibacter sp.]